MDNTRRILFGTAVRDRRLALGMSQVDLALAIGSGKSQIWAIEKGKTNAKFDTICKLADALNIPPHKLMNFE